MKVEIIKKGLPWQVGSAWLVRAEDGRYFVASRVDASLTGWETLCFPCDSEGNVTDWGDVAGGQGISHKEAIRRLEVALDSELEPLSASRQFVDLPTALAQIMRVLGGWDVGSHPQ